MSKKYPGNLAVMIGKGVATVGFRGGLSQLFKTIQFRLPEEGKGGLVGSYYCYVRSNLEKKGVIFRSPVRIFEKGQDIFFELKGPSNTFKGTVTLRTGCLFILMASEYGKAFHHVYKIGNGLEPKVLQGVFSGVSTAFDPIGGRTVLIRQEQNYNDLSNQRSDISALKKSARPGDKHLALYFKEYTNNNVAPNKSTGFSLDDLE